MVQSVTSEVIGIQDNVPLCELGSITVRVSRPLMVRFRSIGRKEIA